MDLQSAKTLEKRSKHAIKIRIAQIFYEILNKWHWLTIIEDFEGQSGGEYLQIINKLRCQLLLTGLDEILSLIKSHWSNNKVPMLASDLMNRFEFIIDRTVEFVLFAREFRKHFDAFVVPLEKNFYCICKLFVILIDAVSIMVENNDSIYHYSKVSLRKQTINLLLWMLSPSKPKIMRMFPIRKLNLEPNLKKVLITLFHKDPNGFGNVPMSEWIEHLDLHYESIQAIFLYKNINKRIVTALTLFQQFEDKFVVFVWQLTYSNTNQLSESELFSCEKLVQRLHRLRVLSTCLMEKIGKQWSLEVQTKIREMTIVFWEREKLYFDGLVTFIKKYCNDVRTSSDIMRKNCSILSGNIIQRLNAQHQKYLYDANVENSIRMEIRMSWTKIIEQFTHERAPWFIRLRPFNFWTRENVVEFNEVARTCTSELNADKKFQVQKCLRQLKYNFEKSLSYLFGENDSNASILSYFSMKDVILDSFNVIKIWYGMEIDGEILIGKENLYFLPTREVQHVDYHSDFVIPFNSINEVFYRTYKSKENCIEMFFLNGETKFLYFFSQEKRDEFIGILKSHISSKRIICCCILDVYLDEWKNGSITNWDYLAVLNKLAGRSYNDPMQYPIMPSILAEYKSETIDLTNPDIYRNLKKLSSVQFINKEFKSNGYYGPNVSSLTTYSPITLSSLENNDSILAEYFHVSGILGPIYSVKKNNRGVVRNIKLPRWANNDYRLSALVYRQLLESQYIRKTLPHWIDVAFGFKRTNKQITDFVKNQNSQSSNCNYFKTSCPLRNLLFTSPHPIPFDKSPFEACSNIPVIQGVRGIKWGNFVGSPSKNPPVVVSKKFFSLPVTAFVPLLTNSMYVVFPKTAPLFFYDYEQVFQTGQKKNTKKAHLSLLYWNPENGIISIKENHIQKPIAFCPPRDPITVCSTTPDYFCVWVGMSSGLILVFRLIFNNLFEFIDTDRNPSVLIGHSDKINGILLSRPFNIAVSVSEDKSAIVWNLNKTTFVRNIMKVELPLNKIAISDTLGDIAIVGYDEPNDSSQLRMHTLDGVFVGSIYSKQRITAICFSTAAEGVSVNVIAAAFQNGVIRLWNTWDLSAVAEFSLSSSSPIISMSYSFDSQDLYVSMEDGSIIVWRCSDKNLVNNNRNMR